MSGYNNWIMILDMAEDFINALTLLFQSPEDLKLLTITVIATIILFPALVSGVFYSFKSFFLSCFEIKDDYLAWTKKILRAKIDSAGNLEYYENYVETGFSNYFRGFFVKQVKDFIEYNFTNIKNSLKEIRKSGAYISKFRKFFAFIRNFVTAVCLIFSGLFITVVSIIMLVIVSTISFIFYLILYSFSTMTERIYYSAHKIQSRCTNGLCKKTSEIPVYFCPVCSVPHKYLRPDKWGIFHRKCICGEYLPCTLNGKSKSKKIPKKDFKAVCPECNQVISGNSRPLGIALLGGANSGKSTFKTAFLFDFINTSAVNHNAEIYFYDEESEYEMENIGKYYRGETTVPETYPDTVHKYDVKAFNFYINHDKFSEKRVIQIYDMPGKSFENQNAQDRMEHFTYIEGIVLLLDPYSIQAVAGMNDTGEMRIGLLNMNTVAERLVESFSQVPNLKKHNKKFTIPVAVCINKVDTIALKNRIGTSAIKKLMEDFPNKFKNDFDTMDYLCRAFLQKNDMGNVITTIDNNFSTVHYFSCTSMGYIPKYKKRLKFQPENVSAVVNWICSHTDRKFNRVFDEHNIKDINENKKKLGMDLSYYEKVENDINE